MTAGIVLCIAVSALLVRPLVLDIPYLSHPETMYLSNLELEDDTNYEYSNFYYVRGQAYAQLQSQREADGGGAGAGAGKRPAHICQGRLPAA